MGCFLALCEAGQQDGSGRFQLRNVHRFSKTVIVRALQAAGWRVGGHQGAKRPGLTKKDTLIAKMKKLRHLSIDGAN